MKTGEDEFCTNCMDWRKINEKGECVVCGKKLRKPKQDAKGYGQVDRNDIPEDSEELE